MAVDAAGQHRGNHTVNTALGGLTAALRTQYPAIATQDSKTSRNYLAAIHCRAALMWLAWLPSNGE